MLSHFPTEVNKSCQGVFVPRIVQALQDYSMLLLALRLMKIVVRAFPTALRHAAIKIMVRAFPTALRQE